MRSKRFSARKRRVVRRKVRVRKTARRKGRRLQNTGFPNRKLVKMKYVESFLLNPAAAQTGVSYVFRAADIHDPSYTGFGHQPLSHDLWQAVYSNEVSANHNADHLKVASQ